MRFWLFVFGIFISWLIWNISRRIAENIKYHRILRNCIDKVKNIDSTYYITEAEKVYELYKTQLIQLKDKKGIPINICPKCGGYMRIVRWRGEPFLGCSNYPNCKSSRKLSKIFELEI